MTNADLITWVADQQRRAFDRLAETFPDDAAERKAKRTNVAWMDAKRQLTDAPAHSDPAAVIRGWKDWIEGRKADPLDGPNAELRQLQLGVADAILSHIEETDR